jgi:hypothetical protein
MFTIPGAGGELVDPWIRDAKVRQREPIARALAALGADPHVN